MKITVCGSMLFHVEMEKVGAQLRGRGHEVEVPELRMDANDSREGGKMSIRDLVEQNGGIDAFPQNHEIWQEKARAIDDHFAKIAWSDAVLIANYSKHGIDGYVGGNTLMEIAVARYLKKKIFILYPISSELSCKEEIFGTQPTIIDGDLSLV